MIKEFRDFIMKGNVLELAIAVILGTAFGAVVTTFTEEVLMPVIGMALGGVDFSDMKYVLKAADGDVAEVAVMYGKWINTIINFLIISLILFLIIKTYNKATAPEPTPAAPAGPTELDLLKEIRDALRK